VDPSRARFDPPATSHVQPADPDPAPAPDVEPRLQRVPPDEAEASLLGVPFDATSGRRPMQRHGPGLLRAALAGSGEDAVPVHDRGEVRVDRDVERMVERTRRAVASAREALDGPVALLGGEHTVSLGAVLALEPASIVSLDAHTDLWPEVDGQRLQQGTWLHVARERLGCEVALPLTRTLRGDAEDEVDRPGTHLDLPADLPEPVYLTVDVDVFDPEDAPAVCFPEPGGPEPGEVLDTVREVAATFEVCGLDAVEVNANRMGPTARLAAGALAAALGAAATRP
jgi:agmatinase